MVEVDMSIVQNEMSVKNFGDNLDDRISKAIEKVKILTQIQRIYKRVLALIKLPILGSIHPIQGEPST